ncbi:MAG: hypothetical protein HQM09_06795, partial [Candidatus Riflebacteria bacterium]|nr:hypothetical protein [Candidatus Riflebacteria bacterium]
KGIKEGKKEGIQEGIKEGKKVALEGLKKLVLSQLEAKFGKIPLADRKIVRTAEIETLLELGPRIITSETIEEVFGR